MQGITVNSRLNPISKPRYAHDCDQCRFHGQLEEYDIYTCRSGSGTVIYRYGDNGSEYGARPFSCMTGRYLIHGRLGSAELTVNENLVVLLRELEECGAIETRITLRK